MKQPYTLNDYIITKDGQVINAHNGHVLKPQLNNKGYGRVSIGGKLYFVHRLVAEKYVPNPDGKEQINHIDGNKENNNANNLEWVDNQENRNHAVEHGLHLQGEQCPYAKLNEEQVRIIRADKGQHSHRYWANKYGVSGSTIGDILHYRTWKHI